MGIRLDGQTIKQVFIAMWKPSKARKLAIYDLTGAKSLDNNGHQIRLTNNQTRNRSHMDTLAISQTCDLCSDRGQRVR